MILFSTFCNGCLEIIVYLLQVGNPETEESYDNWGILDYAWSHAVISDQLYNKARKVCDFKSFDWSNECNGAMEEVFENYAEIDIYDIYAPKCLINSTSSLAHSRGSVESLTEVTTDEHCELYYFNGQTIRACSAILRD